VDLKEAFGQVIRDARIDADKTQEDLAYESDLSVSAISWIERGTNAPSAYSLFAIAQSLEIAPHELIKRVEKLKPTIE